MLVDTHCHLHDREFFTEEQACEMLKRAEEKGVKRVICIGTSHEDSLAACAFASTHDNVDWTYGIHPENAIGSESTFSSAGLEFSSTSGRNLGLAREEEYNSSSARFVEVAYAGAPREPSLRDEPLGHGRNIRVENSNHFYAPEKADSKPPIAIGEVGLDYHYEGYHREAQIRLFEEMLQLASDNELPVVFHVREAFNDFMPVVANFPKVRGVVHSFTDNKKVLKRILNETEFYIGVNGLATYSTLPIPPLERILLETDAPFLTPVPFRGIINEPAYIRNIAEWLGAKLGLKLEIIERETTKNAEKLFKFGNPILCES